MGRAQQSSKEGGTYSDGKRRRRGGLQFNVERGDGLELRADGRKNNEYKTF